MHSNKWVAALLAVLPLLLGIVASVLAQAFWTPVPILVFKIDVGMVAFMMGLILTLFIASYQLGVRVTQQKAEKLIDDTVRESEQRRRKFLRRLDHEIKNPLTGLRAAMVNLQEAQSKDERILAAENARRAVVRLTRLLNDLRKLADLEERSLEYGSVDVPELLNDVVEAARSIPAYEGRGDGARRFHHIVQQFMYIHSHVFERTFFQVRVLSQIVQQARETNDRAAGILCGEDAFIL